MAKENFPKLPPEPNREEAKRMIAAAKERLGKKEEHETRRTQHLEERKRERERAEQFSPGTPLGKSTKEKEVEENRRRIQELLAQKKEQSGPQQPIEAPPPSTSEEYWEPITPEAQKKITIPLTKPISKESDEQIRNRILRESSESMDRIIEQAEKEAAEKPSELAVTPEEQKTPAVRKEKTPEEQKAALDVFAETMHRDVRETKQRLDQEFDRLQALKEIAKSNPRMVITNERAFQEALEAYRAAVETYLESTTMTQRQKLPRDEQAERAYLNEASEEFFEFKKKYEAEGKKILQEKSGKNADEVQAAQGAIDALYSDYENSLRRYGMAARASIARREARQDLYESSKREYEEALKSKASPETIASLKKIYQSALADRAKGTKASFDKTIESGATFEYYRPEFKEYSGKIQEMTKLGKYAGRSAGQAIGEIAAIAAINLTPEEREILLIYDKDRVRSIVRSEEVLALQQRIEKENNDLPENERVKAPQARAKNMLIERYATEPTYREVFEQKVNERWNKLTEAQRLDPVYLDQISQGLDSQMRHETPRTARGREIKPLETAGQIQPQPTPQPKKSLWQRVKGFFGR